MRSEEEVRAYRSFLVNQAESLNENKRKPLMDVPKEKEMFALGFADALLQWILNEEE